MRGSPFCDVVQNDGMFRFVKRRPGRAELLAMIESYETTLRRIAGKPDEQMALMSHLRTWGSPVDNAMLDAFCKTKRIATVALLQYHPDEQA